MENLLLKIYKSKKISAFLKCVSVISVLLGILGFFITLYLAYQDGIITAVKLLALSAAPFLVVTLFRRYFNAPRPYELYGFYEKKPKNKCGKSFPSRHVFSSFIIATFALYYSVPMGTVLYILSVLLAVSRVLLGIHFIRDCTAGALIGIASGVIGILVLQFI